MSEKKISICLNVALIIMWGVIALFHLISNPSNSVSISFLLLYICYVMGKCLEIKYISEVEDDD